MDASTLTALEKTGIVSFKGISGIETTADVAMEAPELVQVYALSGNVYDLARDGDEFELVARKIVFYWSQELGQFVTIPEA